MGYGSGHGPVETPVDTSVQKLLLVMVHTHLLAEQFDGRGGKGLVHDLVLRGVRVHRPYFRPALRRACCGPRPAEVIRVRL